MRQAHKEDHEEARLRKQQKDQYKKKSVDPKKDDDASVEITTSADSQPSKEENNYDGAYLKPK